MHVRFDQLFEHAAGRGDDAIRAHIASCADCAADLAVARRFLAEAPGALDVAPVRASVRRKAHRLLARERRERKGNVFEILIDSLLQPATALRGTATAAPQRYVKLGFGEFTVELYLTQGKRGLDLHGVMEPRGYAETVGLEAGGRTRSAKVDEDGEFRFRGLKHEQVTLTIGDLSLPYFTL